MQYKAYITGADRGLGLALTKLFLEKGYMVYAGSYLSEWNSLSELQEEHQDKLDIVSLDVSSEKSVEDAAREIKKNTDYLDIVVNNAGIYFNRSGNILEKIFYNDMRKMYEVNTLGPLKVTHSVIDLLLKGEKKVLLNISSEAGSIGECWRKKEFGYSMSKSALNMQSAILQNHLEEYDIKVLAVHPGYMKSYMLGEKNMDADIEPEDSAKKLLELIYKKNDLDLPVFYDYQGNELPW